MNLDVNGFQEAEEEKAEDNGGVYDQFGHVWSVGISLELQHVFHSQHIVEHYLLGKLKCVKS